MICGDAYQMLLLVTDWLLVNCDYSSCIGHRL